MQDKRGQKRAKKRKNRYSRVEGDESRWKVGEERAIIWLDIIIAISILAIIWFKNYDIDLNIGFTHICLKLLKIYIIFFLVICSANS